jgi:hypothetical protein
MTTPIKPLDTLLAFKALALHEGLRNSDRQVGCILIEHFNRRTGRLDPGIERMANLAGFHVRTVMRANDRLTRLKIFRKIRHGGYSNRNSYEPNWQYLREWNRTWTLKLKRKSTTTSESLSDEHSRHVQGGARVTQTYCTNPSKKTLDDGSARKEKRLTPISFCSQASSEAYRQTAQRRWDKDLLDHFRGRANEYSRVVEAIDQQLAEQATDAELQRRYGGLELILRTIATKGKGNGA